MYAAVHRPGNGARACGRAHAGGRPARRVRDARPLPHGHDHDRPGAGARPRRAGSCGRRARLERPDRVRDHVRDHRPRRHGRLPPPVHAPLASRRTARSAAHSRSLGSMAIEGPIISWVADHRKHHAFSDREGDPHSPHVDHGHGLRGALRGLAHAHVGWLFIHTQRGNKERYAPDLLSDPVVELGQPTRSSSGRSAASCSRSRSATRSAATGRPASRGCCGAASCGCWSCTTSPTRSTRSATSSAARPSRPATSRATSPGSPRSSFGEAWHNGHHAFPTSARHGLDRWQLDISAGVIALLEKLGLAWDVVRVDPAKLAAKRAAASTGSA